MHVVGTNVDGSHKATTNGVIQIAFDRALLPVTVNRQSFPMFDYTKTQLAPIVTYDPVALVVTLSNPDPSNPNWLRADQPYKVVLGIPDGNADVGGVRAIDRAPLDPAQTRQFEFLVAGLTTDPTSLINGAPINFCNDVLPIFSASCSQGTCHGAVEGKARPAAGLVLATSTGVANTAISRVANGSNTGPFAGAGHSPSHLFGIDMPIIDPHDPGNSWLLYKVLLGSPAPALEVVEAGTTDAGVPPSDGGLGAGVPRSCAPQPPFQSTAFDAPGLSDAERDRLSNFVLGNRMPYPSMPGRDNAADTLTLAEMQRLRAWIQQGAVVTDCSSCPP